MYRNLRLSLPYANHPFRRKALLILALVCIALVVQAAVAGDKKPAQPAAPTSSAQAAPQGKVFGDWGLICENQAKKAQICYISQSQLSKNDGKQVLKISIGYLGAKGEAMVVAMLPLGISLPAGAAFKVDDKQQNPLTIQSCTVDGCAASAILSQDTLQQLWKGKSMIVGVVPSNDHQTMGIRVSLKGFQEGFRALQPQISR